MRISVISFNGAPVDGLPNVVLRRPLLSGRDADADEVVEVSAAAMDAFLRDTNSGGGFASLALGPDTPLVLPAEGPDGKPTTVEVKSSADLYGGGVFRMTRREVAELEASTRVYTDALLPPLPVPSDAALAACALVEAAAARAVAQDAARRAGEASSPWALADAFWPNQPDCGVDFLYVQGAQGEQRLAVSVIAVGDAYRIRIGGRDLPARADIDGERITLTLGDAQRSARVLRSGAHRVVLLAGERFEFDAVDRYAPPESEDGHGGHLVAPMPGSVVSVLVKVGDTVKKGQPLIIMEAMKMEHTIVAPFDGAVEAIYFAAKEQVKEGAELVALAEAAA